MQESGELTWQAGDIYVKRVRRDVPGAQKKWVSMYFRALKGNMTFNQATGLFFQENRFWPLKNLRFMPKTPRDWYRLVREVPRENLYT